MGTVNLGASRKPPTEHLFSEELDREYPVIAAWHMVKSIALRHSMDGTYQGKSMWWAIWWANADKQSSSQMASTKWILSEAATWSIYNLVVIVGRLHVV